MTTGYSNYNDATEYFDLNDIKLDLLHTSPLMDEFDIDPSPAPEPRAHKWRSIEEYREWKNQSNQLGLLDFDEL